MANMLFPTEDGRFCKDSSDRRERLNNYYDPEDEENEYYNLDEEYYEDEEKSEVDDDYDGDEMSICDLEPNQSAVDVVELDEMSVCDDKSSDNEPNQRVADVVELDEDLVNLVARCLAVNPAYRPSLQELAQELEHFVLRVKTQDHYQGTRNEAAESDQNVARIMRQGWMDATAGLKLQTTDDFGHVPWVARTRVVRRVRSFSTLPER